MGLVFKNGFMENEPHEPLEGPLRDQLQVGQNHREPVLLGADELDHQIQMKMASKVHSPWV
jgi:hypothetical protein